jgi:hypothetical protein
MTRSCQTLAYDTQLSNLRDDLYKATGTVLPCFTGTIAGDKKDDARKLLDSIKGAENRNVSDIQGFQRASQGIQGIQGPSRASKGIQRASKGIQGHPRVSKGIQGHPRVSKGVQGCPRASKGIQGCPRVSKGIQGHPRVSKGIQGHPRHPRASKDIQGHPRALRRVEKTGGIAQNGNALNQRPKCIRMAHNDANLVTRKRGQPSADQTTGGGQPARRLASPSAGQLVCSHVMALTRCRRRQRRR